MPKFNINDVDIEAELREFDWTRADWSTDKLIAASPFRYDKSPSFYVYLRDTANAKAGYWQDSGAYDADFAKGGFVKLLAFLRNEDEETTLDYLAEKYAPNTPTDTLTLRIPTFTIQRNRQPLNEALIADLPYDAQYLPSRGIPVEVAQQAGVKALANAVAIPWRAPDGRLANVMYRSLRGKTFWYEKGGVPLRELIYGIDRVYAKRATTAVITEAPIDALSYDAIGLTGLATGGISFTREKRDLILRSPIEELIIVTDNDKAGGKLRAQIESELKGRLKLRHGFVCDGILEEEDGGAKDSNRALELYGPDELRRCVEQAEYVRDFTSLRLR